MIPFPALTAWSLVAAAAVAAAAPPSMWWLALIPLGVAWLGLLARHPAPPPPPVVPVDLRVILDLGSMQLDPTAESWRAQAPSEAAWRARYQVPPDLPIGGWVSGAGRNDEGGGWWDFIPPARPRPFTYLCHFETGKPRDEDLERLADTGELRALR